MRYAVARYNQNRRDMVYRIYVTDCLRIVTENTAKTAFFATRGKVEAYSVNHRFADFLGMGAKEETRTPEEIISGIRKKL